MQPSDGPDTTVAQKRAEVKQDLPDSPNPAYDELEKLRIESHMEAVYRKASSPALESHVLYCERKALGINVDCCHGEGPSKKNFRTRIGDSFQVDPAGLPVPHPKRQRGRGGGRGGGDRDRDRESCGGQTEKVDPPKEDPPHLERSDPDDALPPGCVWVEVEVQGKKLRYVSDACNTPSSPSGSCEAKDTSTVERDWSMFPLKKRLREPIN